ncbi:MAG: DUF3824 domain-containing protein [Oscillibacter sp.]|nr:DUF3824 domain-containing protein [Oscillibacter sp.]MBR1690628.1 DUF3824 domain-containing protein [Oscillibacter sp.]
MAKVAENQVSQPEIVNLALWEQFRAVPQTAQRRIQGGHLNGKTDINPVWRIKVLTEMFGPIGYGWNVKEVERWTNECAGEVAAFVKVELRVKWGGVWSEPIEGTGGSKLCGKGRGEGINDEAWKMATTDAISVACKSLGIAADIYFSGDVSWGTKYETQNNGLQGPRNSAPGNYTGQGVQGRGAARGAENPGEYGPGPVRASDGAPYQAPPAPDPNYQQPVGPRKHQARVCEIADIQKGKAVRLISELSKYDYEDPQAWAAGLAWLRDQVVLGEGAEAVIVQKAVEMRENAQQQVVNGVFQN